MQRTSSHNIVKVEYLANILQGVDSNVISITFTDKDGYEVTHEAFIEDKAVFEEIALGLGCKIDD